MEKQFKPLPNDERLKYHGTADKPDIKIFVSHRIDLDSETIDNPLYIPVRCGAVYDEREKVKMLGDDTGDNISEKRNSFCELTVLYWAWKNIKADYYGLCHYRRYLSFAEEKFKEGVAEHDNGCVKASYITDKNIEKFGLDEEKIRKCLKNNEVVACKAIDVKDTVKTNYNAMVNSPDYHNIADMELAMNYIKQKYPEMLGIVDEYMNSSNVHLYNCFVMRADVFNDFCAWFFDVLFYVEKNVDMALYSQKKYRTPGTIGERLWGIYFLYLEKQGKFKCKENQLVFFEHTDRKYELKPHFNDNQITIASNFNNNYVPIFSVFLNSCLKTFDSNRKYEFIIFSENIEEENKIILQKQIEPYKNVFITYYNPFYLFEGLDFNIKHAVYSKDLFVRPLIPYLLKNFKKGLVLDADMVCLKDLAELYEIDLNGNLLGMVRDVVYGGYLNGYVFGTYEYAVNDLGLKKPYDYCNTGVIVADFEALRNEYSLDYVLSFITSRDFRIYEQDAINKLYEGKVLFIDESWNLFAMANEHIKNCIALTPHYLKEKYDIARKNPFIIHYADHPKPWENGYGDYSIEFWENARGLQFYEVLVSKLINILSNHYSQMVKSELQCSIPQNSQKAFVEPSFFKCVKLIIKKIIFHLPLGKKIWNGMKMILKYH